MHFPVAVAYDPEPGDMAFLPQNIVVQEVANQLSIFNEMDVQPRMWIDHPYFDPDIYDSYSDPAERRTFFWNFMDMLIGGSDQISRDFFATILENGTTTGVLREHAMRLNSSIQCSPVPKTSFPNTCSGRRPFQASFSRPGFVDIKLCIPGEFGVFPWTRVRSRQDIHEELFLDASVWSENVAIDGYGGGTRSNFTVHCKAQTTRGYFEIGNYRNNFTYGPLINEWPSPTEMALEWNDYLNWYANYRPPSNDDKSTGTEDPVLVNWGTWPVDPFGTRELVISGPLMTSAIATSALNQICQQGNIPFSRLGLLKFSGFQTECNNINDPRVAAQGESRLASLVWNWVSNFHDGNTTEEALMASMFLSNQAMLTITSSATGGINGARDIFTAPGLAVVRPAMTLAGKIIISTLIALQLVGIAYTVRYIYEVPTWTAALDAIAVARMGKSMEDKALPPIGPVYKKDWEKLRTMDGIIGVIDDARDPSDEGVAGTTADQVHLDDSSVERPPTPSDVDAQPPFKLGLGAPGLISRKLAPPKKTKKAKRRSERYTEKIPDDNV